ncbi:DoxX family protein [Enterobacteriaceae bacterium 4M9]|nr:DoxX family protein [Enterobacteriaceae bacterium 4M9]
MNKLRYLDFGGATPLMLLIARIALVALFFIFGLPKLTGFSGTVQYMTMLNVPAPTLAAVIAVVMEVLAPILIAIGFFTRPIAILFALYTLGTAFIGHPYWTLTGDAVQPNMINFWKNVSITAAFVLLVVTGPGRYSLDRR